MTDPRLRDILERILDPRGVWQAKKRTICCTAVFGDYGVPAYWFIVLMGSPPKGAVILQTSWGQRGRYIPDGPGPILVDSQGRFRKMSTRGTDIAALDEVALALRNLVPVIEEPHAVFFHTDGTLTLDEPRSVATVVAQEERKAAEARQVKQLYSDIEAKDARIAELEGEVDRLRGELQNALGGWCCELGGDGECDDRDDCGQCSKNRLV